jgi:hypothetical protein
MLVSLSIGYISSGNSPLQQPNHGAADNESGTYQVSGSTNFPKQGSRATLVLLQTLSILPNNILTMKGNHLKVPTFRSQVPYVVGVYMFVKSATIESSPHHQLQTRLTHHGRGQRISTSLRSAYKKASRVMTSALSR